MDQSLKVSAYHNNFKIINDIWTLEPPLKAINKIESVQKRALRFLLVDYEITIARLGSNNNLLVKAKKSTMKVK